MKTTITAVLLCLLAALGLVNVGQSIKDNFFATHHDASQQYTVRVASHGSAEEVMIDERFKVSPGGTLEVGLSHADVEITTSDANEAHVRVLLSGSDMTKAREFFESRNFEVRQDGDRIVVKTNPKKRNWDWSRNGRVEIEVEISIPARFNAELAMSHGDLEMDDLEGNLSLMNSHGDAEISSVDGSFADFKLSHGDVEIGMLKANRVKLRNSHGDLEVDQISAKEITAMSSHGDISLGIKEAGALDISNSHGEIDLSMSSAVGGSISNSHGDIEISTYDNAAMTLDFRGSHVSIDESLSFRGDAASDKARGDINGGGPLLKARTSHGSIEIGS